MFIIDIEEIIDKRASITLRTNGYLKEQDRAVAAK